MNDPLRQKLAELIATYGPELCDDAHDLEALLRHYGGDYRRQINLIMGALREGVAADLIHARGGLPPGGMAALVTRLEENLGMTSEAAGWAVESWAAALGVTTMVAPAAALVPALGPRSGAAITIATAPALAPL